MSKAIYSLTINQYDSPNGTILMNSFKISVCSSAQTLAEIIKEKTTINPPNDISIFAWYNKEADVKNKKGIQPDAPLSAYNIEDNSSICVYLFQASVLPTLASNAFLTWSRNNWRAKFEDDKIPASIFRTPPAAVHDLVSKLGLVHSCSVDTLIKILKDGCVKARSRLAPPRSNEPNDAPPSVYQLIMDNFPTHFDEVLKDKRCPWEPTILIKDCFHCKEKIVNLAEIAIAAKQLGNTRVLQFRRKRFELYFPAFTKEDFGNIEQAALSLATDPRTASRTGIGYWVDEFLGNHEHVFAVMGPNVHYGPVSIMFSGRLMSNPQTKIAINSSTTVISGHALTLRPWLKLAAKEFKATQYGFVVSPDSTFVDSIAGDLNYFAHKLASYGANATRGELELLKQLQRKDCFNTPMPIILREITSQAILAFMKDRSTYDVTPGHDYDYTSGGVEKLKLKDPHFSWAATMDLISGSFPPEERKKDRPEDVTTQDIIDWYMNVDPHGRIEALLPSSIPLTDVENIIIPRNVVTPELSKLLKETKIGGRRLINRVVFTESEEESLKWQQQCFSVLCDD